MIKPADKKSQIPLTHHHRIKLNAKTGAVTSEVNVLISVIGAF
jgi:hypothetical protein